ncbi:MAG: nucleoside triphosphate pyrophosphatase [Myxococcota bacterium]
MSKTLILASTSPFRAAQLRQLGLEFETVAPAVDESAHKTEDIAPEELARTLARLKAENVSQTRPDAVVIGSDQVAVCEGERMGKPGDVERAVQQLSRLQGKTHSLFTAVCVTYRGEPIEHCDHTRLSMRALSEEALRRYVVADDPTRCAGAYKIESRGAALFEAIETEDPTAIVGLPLFALVQALEKFGVPVP